MIGPKERGEAALDLLREVPLEYDRERHDKPSATGKANDVVDAVACLRAALGQVSQRDLRRRLASGA